MALYQRALEADPHSVEAQNNIGSVFLELGQPAKAVGCYRQALALRPDSAEILCNLANAHCQLGELRQALALSERALLLEPGLSVAANIRGVCLAGLGQRERAVASYRRALQLAPHYIEALNNLGSVLRDLGERREALSLHRKAVEVDPQRPESHCNAGNVLLDLRQLDAAAEAFRNALTLKPAYAQAHLGLGSVLRMQGRTSEAEASCRAALALEPNSVEAISLLGELFADRGRFDEAREQFRRALALDPGYPAAYSSLVSHGKVASADPAWRQGVEALLAGPLPLGHQINLRYALGKYCDDLGQYDEAFDNYRQANELTKRYGAKYDREKLARRVEETIRAFDPEFIRRCQSQGSASELPVLVIGMPRSGTSLTEQILASHPAVFGAGEVRFWNGACARFEAKGLRHEEASGLAPDIAREYLQRLTALSAGSLRVIDKMPANFLHAGLIHAVFPRARIIHMQRHPLDTCLSIYCQNFFNMGPYANDLENLAHYYGQYVRITEHWRAVLPAATLLEVPYEALIQDQEGWTRRMLEFVGLPWDARCLEFQETARVVITASRWQVRQRITAASVGRWHNYRKHLAPLMHLLSVAGA